MKKDSESIRLQTQRTHYREHSSPLFLTSSFVYESAEHAELMFRGEGEGDIYSRFSNPNTTELINKMCALEKTSSGIATASGMAAVFSALAAHLKAGDHILASNSLFGNSLQIIQYILPSWGIEFDLVNMTDLHAAEAKIRKNTKLVLIETPSNPGLRIIDMTSLGNLCKSYGILFVVDNCFATPALQTPIDFGADLIIHSGTKWIDGQGRVLGGMVVGPEEHIEPTFLFLKRTGSCLSPFNAWVLSKSLETLGIRMSQHSSNALALAEYLSEHRKIASIKYPFLSSHPQYTLAKKQMSEGGGIVTLDVKGDREEAFMFINNLKMLSITANLGDTRTIITHPATTTHSKLSPEERNSIGITDSTIRISVGLENIEDIITDIDQAFNHSK